jgi:hypothetical protein
MLLIDEGRFDDGQEDVSLHAIKDIEGTLGTGADGRVFARWEHHRLRMLERECEIVGRPFGEAAARV